jgi:hypothetical protein
MRCDVSKGRVPRYDNNRQRGKSEIKLTSISQYFAKSQEKQYKMGEIQIHVVLPTTN